MQSNSLSAVAMIYFSDSSLILMPYSKVSAFVTFPWVSVIYLLQSLWNVPLFVACDHLVHPLQKLSNICCSCYLSTDAAGNPSTVAVHAQHWLSNIFRSCQLCIYRGCMYKIELSVIYCSCKQLTGVVSNLQCIYNEQKRKPNTFVLGDFGCDLHVFQVWPSTKSDGNSRWCTLLADAHTYSKCIQG